MPAGTYLCGSIHLQSNLRLFLDAGAVILGAPLALNAYDEEEAFPGPAFQDGGHTYFHNSLIWGEDLTNVSICGSGLIKGGGLAYNDGDLDAMSGYSGFGKPASSAPPTPVSSYAARQ